LGIHTQQAQHETVPDSQIILVSNFAQTADIKGCTFPTKGALSRRVVAMSESDQFRQYAEEALLWAAQSKTEEEKRLVFELVLT
jgi:hypothetical protein